MTSTFLTEEEVQITGRVQRADEAREWTFIGVIYKRGADGSVLVVRSHVEPDSKTPSSEGVSAWTNLNCLGSNLGARNRNRTGTPLRARDFKSRVSTSFTIRATGRILAQHRRRYGHSGNFSWVRPKLPRAMGTIGSKLNSSVITLLS